MLGNAPVVTNIRCEDVRKQQGFYGEILGLRLVQRNDKGEVEFEAGGGTRLHLYPGPASHAQHTLAAFVVSNIEEEIRSLEARGVVFEDYDLPELKTVNHICSSPEGKCAWFRDPEGNYLSVTQPAS